MNVLVIGSFPEAAQTNILGGFPEDWAVRISAPEDAGLYLAEAEAVIPEHIRIDRRFLEQAPKLRLVQTGAGYDNVDIGACTERGVRVCNAAGVNAAAVAEHVMALLLGFYKNIPYLDGFMKSHRDERELRYRGGELEGQTIGIVGLGNVGRRVAAYCRAFGMEVLGCSRRAVEETGVTMVDPDVLYARSDVVSLHVPLNADTRGMVDQTVFSKMKRGAVLINTSRGAVVDESDLIDALRAGQVRGACLDVFAEEPLPQDSPLRDMDNVILTPHTAGLPDGVKFHAKRYAFFADNIRRVMRGETPACALNEV